MRKTNNLWLGLVGVFMFTISVPSIANEHDDSLYQTISALDAEVFDAFNQCSDPMQLKLNASYFTPDVEFYHDNGGVTWSRKEMMANTEKYVCGHFRRELVVGTLKVFPIKGFGAMRWELIDFVNLIAVDVKG